MAKRRRRIKIKNSSLFAFITLLNLLIASGASSQHNNQQDLSSQQVATTSAFHLCDRLPKAVAAHLKLCKLFGQSRNAGEAVALGASKGLAECRNQFRMERWNCTHAHGDHHLLTSELAQSVGTRESGFVHAIAAAGIVHSIATACSVGNLSDCACDKSRIGSYWHMDEKWKWGGCSNNIRHGMWFAKHMVELLDAVHQHLHAQHHHSHQHHHPHLHLDAASASYLSSQQQQQQLHHRIERRSLSSRNREPNQLRGRQQVAATAAAAAAGEPGDQQFHSFCQRNHNISQAAHLKLIKSLLSANSLERHPEFRMAMNMHNNKVGRMAVAKNMEFRCRCHGLSGSCSLKTCWLSLPNFQVIGAYLKKKYEASVHLPSAVDVNKLIPMMNRDEISAILSNQATSFSAAGDEEQQQQATDSAAAAAADNRAGGEPSRAGIPAATNNRLQQPHEAASTSPMYAADVEMLQADQPAASRQPLSGHFILPTNQTQQHNNNNNNLTAPVNAPSLYSPYYERHRQLQTAAVHNAKQHLGAVAASSSEISEIPVNIAPLSQQQYQALLKDMRLCNNTAATGNGDATATISHLATRDLQQQQPESHSQQSLFAASAGGKRQIAKKLHQPATNNVGQAIKGANQHLSHLLQHSNKDELIYLHKSPNYCDADLKHGFVGIQSRVCSDNPSAPNNCDKLCCGRGYSTRIYQHSYRCDCKFQYCCSIHCSNCERETKLLVCN